MDRDGVSTEDMPTFGRSPDPLDAVLSGDPPEDLRDLATIVDDMTTAYVPSSPVARHRDLLQFTNAPAVPVAAPAPTARRRRAAAVVAGFAATLIGKIVIGSAVAAATLGGLHAADKIDVPLLPEVSRDDPAPSIEEPDGQPIPDPASDQGRDHQPTTVPDGSGPPDHAPAEPPTGSPLEGTNPTADSRPDATVPPVDTRPDGPPPFAPTPSSSVPSDPGPPQSPPTAEPPAAEPPTDPASHGESPPAPTDPASRSDNWDMAPEIGPRSGKS